MAVAYDNGAGALDYSVTSVTTGSFTISGSNRAAFLGLATYAAVSAITTTCGTVSGSAISGATAVQGTYRLYGHQVIAPSTGSQTASASWTTAATAHLLAVTATGVDQTTPLNGGGGDNGGYQASIDLAVTSTSGGLTSTVWLGDSGLYTTSQTNRVTVGSTARQDTGPGTGTTTHTWSGTISTVLMIGANFKAVAAASASLITPRYPMAHLLVR